MDTRNILQADILDIIFDGRNKEYGAYDLRKTYSSRLFKALAITLSICLLFIFGYALAVKTENTKLPLALGPDVNLREYHDKTAVPPPPPPRHIVAVQTATIRITPPRIVPDEQVHPGDAPPENDKADDLRISDHTTNGPIGDDVVAPPAGNGPGVTEAPVKKDDGEPEIFTEVQIQAGFPGGMEGWKRFLIRTWHTPDKAIAENIYGTVVVEFIVDKEGVVSDIKAISGPEELQKEAVRVIGRSGKWTPAIQNGHKVASYKRQPIVVQLVNEE